MIKVSEKMLEISDNLGENNKIRKIMKGSIVSIIITLIMLLIFSIILTYTKLSENTIPTVTIIITAISIIIGGSLATYNIKKNGILNGGLVGLIYILFIYLLSSIITKNFSMNSYSIIMIISSVLAGGLGGIIGVNTK